MDKFRINGVTIKTPDSFSPVFATTSTADSDRTQDLVMHNTVVGTVEGYDLRWSMMSQEDCATLLNALIDKSSVEFHFVSPLKKSGWDTKRFYSANYTVGNLHTDPETGKHYWSDIAVNLRSIYPV